MTKPTYTNQCQFYDGRRTCLRTFDSTYPTIICPICRDFWSRYQRQQLDLAALQARFKKPTREKG